MNEILPETKSPDSENAASRRLRQVRQTAKDTLASGERCVRRNPVGAIAAAFGAGILLGAVIGWSAAEARTRDAGQMLRDRARWWRRALHLN
jgi:hypothetical protein